LCHMANISYRLGQRKPVEQILKTIEGNDLLAEYVERFLKHLQANKVELNKIPATVGPMLTIDPRQERFVGQFSDRANMLLTRNYREPFVVPEKV